MKDILECYKTLGIEPGAAPERVRNAYAQLCRFYDPARYVGGDPELLAKAAQKRKEIEDAYQEIRHFLPALQNSPRTHDPAADQNRDFKEMAGTGPTEVSKTLIAVILAVVLALILGWGYFIYRRTRVLPAAPVLVLDPEAASDQALVAPSTASVPARAR